VYVFNHVRRTSTVIDFGSTIFGLYAFSINNYPNRAAVFFLAFNLVILNVHSFNTGCYVCAKLFLTACIFEGYIE